MRPVSLTNFEIQNYYRNGPEFDNVWMILHWFFYFMLKDKRLLDYANSFSRNGYGKNNRIILKLFQ